MTEDTRFFWGEAGLAGAHLGEPRVLAAMLTAAHAERGQDFGFFGAPASGSEMVGVGTLSAEAVRDSGKLCWAKCTRATWAATRGRSPASGLLIIMTTGPPSCSATGIINDHTCISIK